MSDDQLARIILIGLAVAVVGVIRSFIHDPARAKANRWRKFW